MILQARSYNLGSQGRAAIHEHDHGKSDMRVRLVGLVVKDFVGVGATGCRNNRPFVNKQICSLDGCSQQPAWAIAKIQDQSLHAA